MIRPRALAALALAASGCFYTEVINVAPEARIERVNPSAPVVIGITPVALTAARSVDPDGEDLTYRWEATTCTTCAVQSGDSVVFSITPTTHDPIQVFLQVTDAHGAIGTALLQLEVANQAPKVQLMEQGTQNPDGSYTVGRAIVFRAAGNDPDGDPVSFSFAVHTPPKSPASFTFDRVDEKSYQLVPDADGMWEVEVTAEDGLGGRAMATRTVVVSPDAPPCIDATTPVWTPDARVILVRSGGTRRFSVDSVSDDLDPFPGSENLHFRWFTGLLGQPLVEVSGHDLPDLAIDPTDLDPGDLLDVRVEIADRVARALPCAATQAACSITSSTCYQRLTWTAEAR